jgi:serine/threonine-protein kinase
VLFHELLSLHHYLADRQTLQGALEGVISQELTYQSFAASPHQPPVPPDLLHFIQKGMQKKNRGSLRVRRGHAGAAAGPRRG